MAQVVDDGAGNHRLAGGIGMPNSFTIGDSYFTTGSALNVRGDWMGTSTGEVFRTETSNLVDSYWRMLRGGARIGQLFSLQTDEHFHINAPPGDLRLWTTDIQRARLKRTVTNQTIGTFTGQTISGYFGLGPFSGSGVSDPFSKVHLDGAGTNALGYRPHVPAGSLAEDPAV